MIIKIKNMIDYLPSIKKFREKEQARRQFKKNIIPDIVAGIIFIGLMLLVCATY